MPRASHGQNRRGRLIGVVAVFAVALAAAVGFALSSSGSSSRSAATTAPPTTTPSTTGSTLAATTTAAPTTTVARTTTTKVAAAAATSTMSSCTSVVHIGDSTSESLVSTSYIPVPAQRLDARYAAVGAVHQDFQISGARSIIETWHGFANAYTVASQLASTGWHGCWVVDMGVNDAADIAVGSNIGAAQRIERMMSVIGGQPAMWIAVKSLLSSGPYSNSNMQAWNAALLQACRAHPNMRVLNWNAQALPAYYISDGVHYNSPGSVVLAAALAKGLAVGFPKQGPPPASCLVP